MIYLILLLVGLSRGDLAPSNEPGKLNSVLLHSNVSILKPLNIRLSTSSFDTVISNCHQTIFGFDYGITVSL